MKFSTLKTDKDGGATGTFNRPPVNAVSFEIYPGLCELAQSPDTGRTG